MVITDLVTCDSKPLGLSLISPPAVYFMYCFSEIMSLRSLEEKQTKKNRKKKNKRAFTYNTSGVLYFKNSLIIH